MSVLTSATHQGLQPAPCGLGARPTLRVKKHAASARPTQQPLASARITQPKRPAPDGAMRERHVAPWTLRRFTARVRRAYLLLFRRGVRR